MFTNKRICKLISLKKDIDEEISLIRKTCKHNFNVNKTLETKGERDPAEWFFVTAICKKCGFSEEYYEDI